MLNCNIVLCTTFQKLQKLVWDIKWCFMYSSYKSPASPPPLNLPLSFLEKSFLKDVQWKLPIYLILPYGQLYRYCTFELFWGFVSPQSNLALSYPKLRSAFFGKVLWQRRNLAFELIRAHTTTLHRFWFFFWPCRLQTAFYKTKMVYE